MPSSYVGTRLGLLSSSDLPPLLSGSALDLNAMLGLDTVTDGAGVGSWTDQAGSVAFTQATAGQKPTYQAVSYGGRPSLKFVAASSQILSAAAAVSAINVQNVTVYIVVAGLVDSDGIAGRVFANFTSGGGTNSQGFHLTKTTSNIFSVFLGIGTSSSTQVTIGSSLLASGAHVLAVSIRGQSTAITKPYYDGVAQTTSSAAYKQQTSSVTAPSVGGATGGGNYLNAAVSRILVYGTDHSADQLTYMTAALKARYGTP